MNKFVTVRQDTGKHRGRYFADDAEYTGTR